MDPITNASLSGGPLSFPSQHLCGEDCVKYKMIMPGVNTAIDAGASPDEKEREEGVWGIITGEEYTRCFIKTQCPASNISLINPTYASSTLTVEFLGVDSDKFYLCGVYFGSTTVPYTVRVKIGWIMQVSLLTLGVILLISSFCVRRSLLEKKSVYKKELESRRKEKKKSEKNKKSKKTGDKVATKNSQKRTSNGNIPDDMSALSGLTEMEDQLRDAEKLRKEKKTAKRDEKPFLERTIDKATSALALGMVTEEDTVLENGDDDLQDDIERGETVKVGTMTNVGSVILPKRTMIDEKPGKKQVPSTAFEVGAIEHGDTGSVYVNKAPNEPSDMELKKNKSLMKIRQNNEGRSRHSRKFSSTKKNSSTEFYN